MPETQSLEKYREDLTRHLMEVCTGNGYLDGKLLNTPDIDEVWERIAPGYYGDAVLQFNAWPQYSLACAGFLGMAVAKLWDEDWTRYRDVPYAHFLGARGFDDMDDHITDTILGEREPAVPAMQSAAAEAHHFLLRTNPEPGTADAYRRFLVTASVLFRLGAAIELRRLGYKLEKAN